LTAGKFRSGTGAAAAAARISFAALVGATLAVRRARFSAVPATRGIAGAGREDGADRAAQPDRRDDRFPDTL
jgi:hypothetical protein